MNEKEYKQLIESALEKTLANAGGLPQAGLAEAMRYSLLAGGKRIRPMLTLEFCRVCGGDINAALPVACGVEMLHTYSLIHDDLPCMDNDDLRRGRPTNHKVYGECVAMLAGDALQAQAFYSVLSAELPADRRAACAQILASAVGFDGMCGGQYLDMLWEGRKLNEQELSEINSRKTGALLVAACQMGVAAAGGTESQLAAAGHYGAALGLAFQIRDDMLDVLSTTEELGKPVGSDADNDKTTFITLYGLQGAHEEAERHNAAALAALDALGPGADFLRLMAAELLERKK